MDDMAFNDSDTFVSDVKEAFRHPPFFCNTCDKIEPVSQDVANLKYHRKSLQTSTESEHMYNNLETVGKELFRASMLLLTGKLDRRN